jgi:hypothetical protein
MDISKDLALDLYHLDDSILSFPQLTEDWNSKAVEVEIDAMNKKVELEKRKDELNQDMRENPGNYGMTKVTENSIASAVNIHKEIIVLTDEYYKLLSEQKRLKSKCASIAILGKALDLLTDIYKAGYFASKPICAMETKSTIIQEKETSKLNTGTSRERLIQAKSNKDLKRK